MVELPETRVETRPEIFEFLLSDLVFTAGVLRAQGKAVYRIWADAGDPPGQVHFDGTTGIVMTAQLLKREPGRWIYYSKGTYDLGLFTVPGRSVIMVVHETRTAVLTGPYLRNQPAVDVGNAHDRVVVRACRSSDVRVHDDVAVLHRHIGDDANAC
jgi:hypothetical protein